MPTSSEPSKQSYTVKSIESVVVGADVQARIFTLAPGEVIPWHFHSETTDHYFVLSGTLTVNTRSPEDRRAFAAGERYKIMPGHAHMLSNHEKTDCQFLLLQGIGKYDWIKVET